MLMSWIWTGMLGLSVIAALILGRGNLLAAAICQGAQAGISLAVSIGGSLCLWSGVGALMEKAGMVDKISRVMHPILHRIFPSTKRNASLSNALSANICANLLGLGNAATPMGIQAATQLSRNCNGTASDELCKLVVLNTASIQLIPATVAAVRVAHGCTTPFDILLPVWITSFCSAGAGLLATGIFRKIWRNP
ncbi:MAG: spore maturation protein A [Oscillospiraceae bacterium]|nr:spore maturation protein A [Oscillospiraceae bacterium]MBQ4642554.1 spore maturation protein A [Oscillospiraceae bacterium]